MLLPLTVAPDLVWPTASTVRIHNSTSPPVSTVAYMACATTHPIVILESGESTFRFLESCGDDALELVIGDCLFAQTYAEGELHNGTRQLQRSMPLAAFVTTCCRVSSSQEHFGNSVVPEDSLQRTD